jgi:hypothetical protein
MTKSADSYKQARTERGEGLDRRNSSGRSSERRIPYYQRRGSGRRAMKAMTNINKIGEGSYAPF